MKLRVLGLLALLCCLSAPASASAADPPNFTFEPIVGGDSVTFGNTIVYRVKVKNVGATEDNPVVTVTAPAGTIFAGTCVGGRNVECRTDAAAATRDLGTVASNGISKELFVLLEPDTIGSVTLQLSVTGTGTDPATASKSTTINPRPNRLTIGLAASPNPASSGETITYTATVTNPDTARAKGVTVTFTPPGGGTPTTAALGTIDPSGTATTSFSATAGGPGTYTGQAAVQSETTNGSVSTSASAKVTGPPTDLGVSLTGPATGFERDTLTYEATVVNGGGNEAQGVTVTITVPPGMTIEAAEAAGGCTEDSATKRTCVLGTVPAGQSAKATLKANPPSVGSYTLSTAVQSAARDDNTANDSAAFTTNAVAKVADLSVRISDPGPVLVRTTFDLELSVVNAGPAPADGARFDIAIPPGVTYTVKARPRTPWLCNQIGQVLECLMQRIGAGSEPKIVLAVRAERAGAYAWSGSVSSGTPDPAPQGATTRTVNVVTELPATPTDPTDPGDPADPAPPKLALTAGLAAKTMTLAKGIKVVLDASRRASVRLALAVKQRGGALTVATKTVSGVTGERTLKLKLSRTARRAVSRLKAGTKLVLSVTATPANGRAVTKRLTLRVARAGRLKAA